MAQMREDFIIRLAGREGFYSFDHAGDTIFGVCRHDHATWDGFAHATPYIDAACKSLGIDRYKNPPTPQQEEAISNFMAAVPGLKAALRALAAALYKHAYWDVMLGDFIESQDVAEEIVDTAINCGCPTAAAIVQRVLNAGNQGGKDYPNVHVTGRLSQADIKHMNHLTQLRRPSLVVKALNVLQGSRYFDICEGNEKYEKYFWGWIDNRA